MSLPTLPEFVAEHLPGDRTPTADGGFVVTCPACSTADALKVRPLGGTVALFCGEPDCSRDYAAALGLSEHRFNALLDSVDVGAPTTATDRGRDRGERGKPLSSADVVRHVLAHYRLGSAEGGLLFAVPTDAGVPRVLVEIDGLRPSIAAHLWDSGEKTVGRDAMSAALETLKGLAARLDPEPVALRATSIGDDRVVVDLGDATGRVVEVTPAGWTVVPATSSTPLFRRTGHTPPLGEPERGGDLDTLRDLLGLEHDRERWLLARGWLVGTLFADVPRPILWATGQQGSGKSTRARMLVSVVNPVEALSGTLGKNRRDDDTNAMNRYLVTFDNLSTITQEASNWLCTLVTKIDAAKRTLYTDGDLTPMTFRRSGVATSLSLPSGLGSDALERLVVIGFDRMPEGARRGERELWTAYNAARPALLGALLDEVVLVLRHLGDVATERRSLPRMADYAHILLALDRGLGLSEDNGHFSAYVASMSEALADRAKDDPFASVVLRFVDDRRGHWKGSAADLLDGLNAVLARDVSLDRPQWWPKSDRVVRNFLTDSSEALRHAGVRLDAGRSNGTRWLELTRLTDEQAPAAAAAPHLTLESRSQPF